MPSKRCAASVTGSRKIDMMTAMRFRTRLLLSFWMILILALCLPAYYISQTLKNDVIREATANALTELHFVGWLLEKAPDFEDSNALDKWCKELGSKVKYRITVIAAGGRVIADSEVKGPAIPALDNHADREEVIGARKYGQASSIRYSATLKKNLIYAAENINSPVAPSGVLRVAIPLSFVEARLTDLGHQFWAVLLVIFAAAAILSVIFARRLEAPIHNIIQAATAIGEGDFKRPVEVETGTEFAPLAHCINDMAAKIKQNIEKITNQKQELEAVLEGMQEGVMLLDREGKIKAVNPALMGIAGCLRSCAGRRPVEIFLDAEIQTACDQILSGKKHLRLKITMPNDRMYEVNLVDIPEDGAVVVFHDISELVRLEKIRQDFVANVSHELRTPLTSIKGYAETLLDPAFRTGEQAQGFVNVIVKNADQMSRLVADLLELTKLQQKNQNRSLEKFSTFNAAVCFRSAEEICMPMLNEKNIRIRNLLAESIPVTGDEHALEQVFRNLLDNAIRYSPDGSIVTVSSRDADGMVVFSVLDEGAGIPRQHLKRIFERFYRVDKERSRASGGTGLGLAICRNAVQKMGGDIWAESPPENHAKGSGFYFSLKKALD